MIIVTDLSKLEDYGFSKLDFNTYMLYLDNGISLVVNPTNYSHRRNEIFIHSSKPDCITGIEILYVMMKDGVLKYEDR